MKRVSVDIGGTFTDCFVSWGECYVQAKALTTHHNLAAGFNEALELATSELGITKFDLLSQVDSVRYSTTLGTNALIERKGPRIGLLVTDGFGSSVPLSRGRGHGDGLPYERQHDVPRAVRPEPIVPIPLIRNVRERVSYNGEVLLRLDEDDLRGKLRDLVDQGAETLVVQLANSVVNPAHELRVREIFLEEYPGYYLGAVPMLLSHQVAGRKGEYTRAMSTIIDGFLHNAMYHGLGGLELSLRENGYAKPMLINHNSGGMAQLNSTDALQTVHSGPVAGIAASEHLARETGLGNVIATDMGGTSFDIGIVTADGEKHYDFNPVIDRWLVSIPMVHLVTLGAGGGSIASYDPLLKRVKIGPESAGSDPGPACYNRGGRQPTVTDADLALGYLDPNNYAKGRIKLNARRAERALLEALGGALGADVIAISKVVKETVDHNMANGIATELRSRGYIPDEFTMLAYGGNGPLHCCGIASALGIGRVLAPPFSSVFSALGAGNVNQLHIHEKSTYTVLFHTALKKVLTDYTQLNATIDELKQRGRDDLTRQGMPPEAIKYRLEFDMRYGNQRAETAVAYDIERFASVHDALGLIEAFHRRYGERFGEGSQATEAGVRINTVRVSSYIDIDKVHFGAIMPLAGRLPAKPVGTRPCHFVGGAGAVGTALYDDSALVPGTSIDGPAVITTFATTYLVEPGWNFHASNHGAAWFTRKA
ncbi:MAG: hydantoinase/oxoprolinase family protein [Gammaproteobacteria bacterium]|nr:hydantoinase/oxoprolinase family protein [Gammaproteobacteria bacterium]MBI5614937.1 hydantoinase/oxoprolinase family protein [Gammaproteobacteria bacterium]